MCRSAALRPRTGDTDRNLRTNTKLTFRSAREYVRHLGMTLVKTEGDDYRVRFIGDPPGYGYFTDDLEDAVRTAKAMFEARNAQGAAHHRGRFTH